MRVPLRTTFNSELLDFLRFKALELKVDMNDILEELTMKYKHGDVDIAVKRKRGEKPHVDQSI